MEKKKLVVLTGAGVSAESGVPTFRDSDGLWQGHDIMEVASPEGWRKNPELVLEFYNLRRRNVGTVHPNPAHKIIAELEDHFDVTVITQNVDNLHERAGSTNIIHLHGEITKARSCGDEFLVYDIGTKDIMLGDKCENGHQLRPHIVWFGEAVPMIELAADITASADIFLVVGTSLLVYPAAGLLGYAPDHAMKFLVDPNPPSLYYRNIEVIKAPASEGMEQVKEKLLKEV